MGAGWGRELGAGCRYWQLVTMTFICPNCDKWMSEARWLVCLKFAAAVALLELDEFLFEHF